MNDLLKGKEKSSPALTMMICEEVRVRDGGGWESSGGEPADL